MCYVWQECADQVGNALCMVRMLDQDGNALIRLGMSYVWQECADQVGTALGMAGMR